MSKGFVAHQTIVINAPTATVWDALTNPKIISQYMFGTNVVTDWNQGSPIFFKGEWQGRAYEDKGVILRIERNRYLTYTHFSPLAGVPDVPENYHTVDVELAGRDGNVIVTLAQDNNPTDGARKHSEENWGLMLRGMKSLLEK